MIPASPGWGRRTLLIAAVAACLLCSPAVGAVVADSGGDSAQLTVGNTTVAPGEAVWVPVVIDGGVGAENLRVAVGNASRAHIVDARIANGHGEAVAYRSYARLSWEAAAAAQPHNLVVGELLVRGLKPGQTTLRITDSVAVEGEGGDFLAIRRNNGTLTVGDGDGGSDAPATHPDGWQLDDQSVQLSTGESATVPITATAPLGLSAADVSVRVGAGAPVRIENASVDAAMTTSPANATRAQLTGVGYGQAAGTVTVGTVTVRGIASGTTTLTVVTDSVATSNATAYAPGAPATVTVRVKPPSPARPQALGGDGIATDPDADGVFEDVTGDGTVNVVDVQVLFRHREAASEAFDLNGDGAVDVVDVQSLFNEVTA